MFVSGRGVDVEASTAGVEVTLIDFTLSRLRTADGAGAFCDLAADPELFQGPRGDCQVSAQSPYSHSSMVLKSPLCPGLPGLIWPMGVMDVTYKAFPILQAALL